MKNLFKSTYSVPFFLMLSTLIFTGCGYYSSSRERPHPTINGELNPSGIQKIMTYRVIGRGIEPERSRTKAEAILMAERAAIADGYRQLVEKLHGIYIDSQALINNGSVNYSLLQAETQAWLRGAEIVEINRLSNGITEAEMLLRLNFIKRKNCWTPWSCSYDSSYAAAPVPSPSPPSCPPILSCPSIQGR